MTSDSDLQDLAARIGRELLASRRRLATAESCTGGFVAKTLTDIPGSSQWFECGYVTYSNEAKTRDLGVAREILAGHGAVSEATARAMAAGALHRAGVDIAVAVTGIAGPDGALPGKPVGTVWFGTALRADGGDKIASQLAQFTGDRDAVRRRSVEYVLKLILRLKS